MDYLSNEFGQQSVLINKVTMMDKNSNALNHPAKRNTFSDFLNKTQNSTWGGVFSYYIKNEMIISKQMQGDIIKPEFITKVLRNRHTGLTIWMNFPRKPEYKERERYFCVLDGTEEFRLVSPTYKQEIYSGVLE